MKWSTRAESPLYIKEESEFSTYQENSLRIGSVASRGIEPPTHALGKRRSIQLSYEAMLRDQLFTN